MKSLARRILGSAESIYFFVIILAGSLCVLKYGFSWFSMLGIIGLDGLIAVSFSTLVLLTGNRKMLRRIVLVLIAVIANIPTLTDIFLLATFGKPFNQDMMDIVVDTNMRETSEFFATYLPVYQIVLLVIAVVLLNAALYKGVQCLQPPYPRGDKGVQHRARAYRLFLHEHVCLQLPAISQR